MNTSSKRRFDRDGRAQGRHAVVLGGSLAGLLAARVLADHFDEVTLIERDAYPETPEVRRGIPQANHVNKAPWLLATGEDYRYPETKGQGASLMTKFMHRYMNRVLELATQSVEVRGVLLRAFSMLVPPTALFHPRISLRVLARIAS